MYGFRYPVSTNWETSVGLQPWKQALAIVQPDMLLRWHRDLYRWLWKRKSRTRKQPGRLPLSEEIVALTQRMTRENRTWGAKRIRGELLKLGMHARRVRRAAVAEMRSQA